MLLSVWMLLKAIPCLSDMASLLLWPGIKEVFEGFDVADDDLVCWVLVPLGMKITSLLCGVQVGRQALAGEVL